ncbi:MAG: acyl--CoA ligase [Ectothiorhodospiraceae bacterium]|nr:acyl--CoA ligase [Ectothiorhodospiraceae bacterium]
MRPFLTLHDPAHAREHYARGVWRDETFYGLLCRWARERPDALALRDAATRLTWSEVRGRVDALAARFRADGLVGGDRVSLWMSNRVEAVIAFLACSREGLACNPSLHRTYTCAEIATLLERLRTRVLITEPGWGADRDRVELARVLEPLADLRAVYQADDLPATGAAPPTPAVTSPDKVAYLAFTSGTTGMPKCVMHSDNTLLANARDLARDWGLGPDTRLLSLSPVSHHIAWVGVSQWLLGGCEYIVDRPPAGMTRLDWLVETGATYVMGVPTHAMDMLAEQRARGIERLGAVETFYMAGAPIPPTVAASFVAQGIKPQNVYGMTENSSHQYTHPADDTDTIVATCGRGGPAYEVRIFDADDCDRDVGRGVVGQIGGRGAALMLGYFANQQATEESFNRDGWFMSGDLGMLDEQGNLHVTGRLKDMIIRGGKNIYPAHVEAVTLRHPLVERAAMFAVADERLGERACMAVLGTIDADTLIAHLRAAGVSVYDLPEYFLRVDAFPLTASGKILKRELVEMARRGDIAPQPVRRQPRTEPKPESQT